MSCLTVQLSSWQAKSQQDKRLWVLHLKRLILENHAAKIPAKVRQGGQQTVKRKGIQVLGGPPDGNKCSTSKYRKLRERLLKGSTKPVVYTEKIHM